MAFNLELYPIIYFAQYNPDTGKWEEHWHSSDDLSQDALNAKDPAARAAVLAARNAMPLPGCSFTSQYGYGCFEGMKAFPTKDGGISIFRPDRNAARFANSMRGLLTEPFPEDMYVNASKEFIRRNAALGYCPKYDSAWEADNYATASSIYMRPFMNSEGAIGVGIAKAPYVVICATTVSTYFKGGNTKAITTERVRAMPHGTGCLKCAANYVMSAIAKKEAENAGYMEVVFLDGVHHKYLQEGSSCNIFVRMQDGTLCTPELGDTILPGITRASVIQLAKEQGVKVEERPVDIAEVMANGAECFVTGTAAGITPIESITHNGVEKVFNNRKPGDFSVNTQKLLKGRQYGLLPDVNNWNAKVC